MKYPLKRHFVLLEVIIALALTMLLLTILMTFYMNISKINLEVEKDQEKSFRQLYLSTRLAAIVPNAISPTEKDFFFYTASASDSLTKSGSQTLLFTFNNNVKLDSSFANHVIGRLYLSAQNQLCLAMWPSPSRQTDIGISPIKHEVLFENVESLSFEFFVPPSRDRKLIFSKTKPPFKETDFLKEPSLGEWKTDWQETYKELPALIKITLKGPTTITLVYPLPRSRFIIVYESQ